MNHIEQRLGTEPTRTVCTNSLICELRIFLTNLDRGPAPACNRRIRQ